MSRRPDSTWLLRGVGTPVAGSSWLMLRRLREEGSLRVMLGLRCDLAAMPDVRPPKLATVMRPRDSLQFRGFHEELARVSGRGYLDAFVRTRACEAGVQTLFASEHES